MSHTMPPEYLMGVLQNIEKIITIIYQEYPRLADKDVAWVIEKLINYYKARSRGKEIEEPTTPSEMKQALIDEILNIIDQREELEADIEYINNPNIRHGEYMFASLEQFYVVALKRIQSSLRFWTKEAGRTGYLRYISEFL
ncbi:MAG TPA: hypothetical protein ENJ53_04630 [Phaeodactylibacter sp.]|nr:hypothetical protein [Phaeodactylibacter sp.]